MPDIHNRERTGNAHRFAPAAPDEEHVFGSCSPGWHTAADHDDALADWIGFVRARDIERVCCLLPGDELGRSGGAVDVYRDVFGDERVLHAPVPDCRVVAPGLLDHELLPFLDDAVAADERVVVQGLSGLCRTGQVLAVWLAHDRGYDPDRAIDAVEEMGRRPRDVVDAEGTTERELRDLIATFA